MFLPAYTPKKNLTSIEHFFYLFLSLFRLYETIHICELRMKMWKWMWSSQLNEQFANQFSYNRELFRHFLEFSTRAFPVKKFLYLTKRPAFIQSALHALPSWCSLGALVVWSVNATWWRIKLLNDGAVMISSACVRYVRWIGFRTAAF